MDLKIIVYPTFNSKNDFLIHYPTSLISPMSNRATGLYVTERN